MKSSNSFLFDVWLLGYPGVMVVLLSIFQPHLRLIYLHILYCPKRNPKKNILPLSKGLDSLFPFYLIFFIFFLFLFFRSIIALLCLDVGDTCFAVLVDLLRLRKIG